jgi:hypothetical protein
MKIAVWICQFVNVFFLIVSLMDMAAGSQTRFPLVGWLVTLSLYWTFLFCAVVIGLANCCRQRRSHEYHKVGQKKKKHKDWQPVYLEYLADCLISWSLMPVLLALIFYAHFHNDGEPHALASLDILVLVKWVEKSGSWMAVPMFTAMFSYHSLKDGIQLMRKSDALICQRK